MELAYQELSINIQEKNIDVNNILCSFKKSIKNLANINDEKI